jgi:hypothetical protein
MSDWHNNCVRCGAGAHREEDAREGHGDTKEWRVAQGYTCICGVHATSLPEWHDHLVGNDEEQQRQEEAFEKILDEVVTKYGETLRRLGGT